MSTATMTLPNEATGWQVPTTTPLAPWCQLRPAEWWEIDNPNVDRAIKLCGVCPFRAGCGSADPVPGMVQGGVAYSASYGRPLDICAKCERPRVPVNKGLRCGCRNAQPADHHDEIVAMLAEQFTTYQQVADSIGATRQSVKSYWRRVIDVNRAGDNPARPADHHDRVRQMLDNGATYSEVAVAIGATREAVKSHWIRWTKSQQARAARASRTVAA